MAQRFVKMRGDTLEEAFRKLREKYGPEAVVMGTRQITKGGLFGWFGRTRVEITASAPAASAPARPVSAVERKYTENTLAASPARTREDFERIIREAQQRMNLPAQASAQAPDQTRVQEGSGAVLKFPNRKPEQESSSGDLRREMQDIREMLQVLYAEHPGAGLPPEFAPHYRMLVQRGVSRKVAAMLIAGVAKETDMQLLQDPRVFTERLHLEIRRRVNTTGGIALHGGQCRLVALCGPTGVGKTTNLAKLAAHYAVHERARVGLLTCDTYRVAALEQLRVYANIIGTPLHVANDAKEAAAAVDAFRGYDLVLMDTAGGSQFNLEQINELKGILGAVRPHETILVMSATTQIDDLRSVASNFKCIEPTSIMFSKLDETRQYGVILSMLAETELPLSYVSVGQNVPDDISVATPGMTANLILEGKDHRG